jgi:hypothetical protein
VESISTRTSEESREWHSGSKTLNSSIHVARIAQILEPSRDNLHVGPIGYGISRGYRRRSGRLLECANGI